MVTPKNDVNVTQTRPVNIIPLEAALTFHLQRRENKTGYTI